MRIIRTTGEGGVRRRAVCLIGLRLVAIVLVAVVCGSSAPGEVFVDVGEKGQPAEFGFGWGRFERSRGGPNYAWMRNHLEADLWVSLASGDAADFEIRVAAFYTPQRRQTLGLYVNDRFIAEWVFPHVDGFSFECFEAVIPEGVLTPGRNRITLRAGYTAGRGHAVAVDWLRVKSRQPSASATVAQAAAEASERR